MNAVNAPPQSIQEVSPSAQQREHNAQHRLGGGGGGYLVLMLMWMQTLTLTLAKARKRCLCNQ
ncbi:GH12723 [Drosophila grimshawi]|uniref:GH12723 n=1 Tax=Drosophila grimshawi TaxID=7222 RepID=B4JKR9_DROGR|nr:GH12723 [Drosophila grimshawi]